MLYFVGILFAILQTHTHIWWCHDDADGWVFPLHFIGRGQTMGSHEVSGRHSSLCV